MILLGLSGYARSGKDTVAEVLVNEYGWTRIAFADKLRYFLYALDPIVTCNLDQHNPFDGPIAYRRLRSVIDEQGWDGYKKGHYSDEIRSLLQRLGTEAGRETLWDTIWIDAALKNLEPDGKYVISDMRFPNEAQAIKDRGGRLVRITRKGVGPANQHPSETSLDDYPFQSRLTNDGTLEEFQEKIRKVFV